MNKYLSRTFSRRNQRGAGDHVVWTIVGILAIVALVIWIARTT